MASQNEQQRQVGVSFFAILEKVYCQLTHLIRDMKFSADYNKLLCFKVSRQELVALEKQYLGLTSNVRLFEQLLKYVLESAEFNYRVKQVFHLVGSSEFYIVFRHVDETDLDF